MKKKMIVMMMAAAMLVSPLFASGSKEASVTDSAKSDGPIELSVFGFKTASQAEIIKTLIAEYNEANPDVVVSYEGLTNPGGYQNVLTTRLASGQGDDIFFSSTSFINKIEQSGYTLDLSDEAVLDNYTQNMKVGDSVPGLAMATAMFGMYVNNDLLREVGIDSVPQTKEEWLRDCEILQAAGKTPIIAGASDGTGAAIIIMAKGFEDLYLNSGNKEAGIKAIDNGEVKLGETLSSGFELDQLLIEKGFIDGKKAIVMNAFTDGTSAFAKGDVGFFLMGSWAVASVKESMPNVDVTFEGVPVSDNAPIVLSDAGVRLCVNSATKYPEQAKKFIEFMTSTPINDRYCADQSSFTVLKDGTSTSDPMVSHAAEVLKSGRFIPWADTSYANIDTWALAKQFGSNVFAGVPAAEAVADLDEANDLNLSLL
jgi:ABC-type glycerol-3-phosphate transport system substrate-binding protein